MNRHVRSLRLRVTLLATATTAVLVLAFGWWLTELIAADLVDSGEAAISELTEDIDGLALVELGEDDAVLRVDGDNVIAVVEVDDDGDLFVELFDAGVDADDVIGAFVMDTGTGNIRQLLPEDGGLAPERLAEASENVAATIVETASVAVGTSDVISSTRDVLDDVSAGVDAARSAALRIGPLLVLVSGLVTWFVVGRALAPTRRIAAEAAEITADRLDHRIPLDGRSHEVDAIARVINEMLDRIEADVRREQRFVADASHELKTPLATARMAAELAGQDAPDSHYPPQLVEEIDRMRALVDDLLELARDTPEHRRVEPIRLDRLVGEALDASPASEVATVIEAAEVMVPGRATELRRVVINLLDNATRYATARVEVTVAQADGEAIIAVDDDGPGIPEADRERVFDRFSRLDDGRARTDGGSGLGLSIVRAIVERHRGTITITDSPIGGTRAIVRLPTA